METLTDKDEVVKLVEQYLKDNSICDLTGFIQEHCPDTHNHSAFVRDIAHRMRRTGKYEIEALENGQRFHVRPVPNKPFREKHWFLIAVIAYIMGVASPIIVKSIERKIWQESNQSTKTIQEPQHTLKGH